jgi:hypothetical protein
MFSWLRKLFRQPQPCGPTRCVWRCDPREVPLTRDGVEPADGGWRIRSEGHRTIQLFEVPVADLESCRLSYGAQLRTEDASGKVYLEMWCRVPGAGEFFSRGLQSPVTGTTDWTSQQVPFFLQPGQRPDLLKLNVVMEGGGTVWVRELLVETTQLQF